MGDFIWPVSTKAIITSPFGPRWGRFHYGTDLSYGGCLGGRIVASRAGTVIHTGPSGTYGNLVKIRHGGGVETRYAHCSAILVRKGDKVRAGQQIAKIGSTGRSTGPHLHFEIRINGTAKNPMQYVSKSDTAASFTGDKGSSSKGSTKKTTKQKEIQKIEIVSTVGKTGKQDTSLRAKGAVQIAGCEVLIQNQTTIYQPELEGEMTLTRERAGSPAKLEFSALDDGILHMRLGDPVRFRYDNQNAFFGYLFSIKPEHGWFRCTAYDQMRYLKNKDSLIYKKKTYSQLLKLLARRYQLTLGSVANTRYVIPKRKEDATLLDILGTASSLTTKATGRRYVLYDDFGKLTLKNISDMRLDLLLDADTVQAFELDANIDNETYSRVKLYHDNTKKGVREIYLANGKKRQAQWGWLQYMEQANATKPEDIRKEAKRILERYGTPQKKLSIDGAFGDIRVRGGSSLKVQLDLEQLTVSDYLYVERVTHKWNTDSYLMDLVLYGGGFRA